MASAGETQSLTSLLGGLRAAGEETRLRILALLAEGELSVSDLTDILGQSQPRISRHLKLMAEAGLVRRHREGAFAFFRLAEGTAAAVLAQWLASRLDRADAVIAADRERLDGVRTARAQAAQSYFAGIARDWDRLRTLHASDEAVEAAVLAALGEGPFAGVLDLGTGTGRILSLLAPRAARAVGVDASHAMLQVARANLERIALPRAHRVDLRQGDIYALPFGRNAFDVVVIHQVLHFLDDPARALREAAATLMPGGRLVVVDFAPHELEFLRAEHAHRRLGFAKDQVSGWMAEAGLDCDLAAAVPAPEESGTPESQRLTVMIWRGRDRRVQGDLPLRQDNLEVA